MISGIVLVGQDNHDMSSVDHDVSKDFYLSSNLSNGLLVRVSLDGCEADGTVKVLFGGFCLDCRADV